MVSSRNHQSQLMCKNQPTSQISTEAELINQEREEELLAAREEIELLREMLESQKLHIHELEQELQETNQELEIINEQLAKTLLAGASFEEAKAVAQTILQSETDSRQVAIKLLEIIYNQPVAAQELNTQISSVQLKQVNNQPAKKVVLQSQKFRQRSKELQLKNIELYRVLRNEFFTFIAILDKIHQQLSILNNFYRQNYLPNNLINT